MSVTAVLIHEETGKMEEINLDISPEKNEIFKKLCGPQTFIGQWPDIDVVIMKSQWARRRNTNKLPPPFDTERVAGKVLLVRMDEDSEPQNFSLREYRWYKRGSS